MDEQPFAQPNRVLARELHGDYRHPVVCLLHGFPLDRSMWKAQVAPLVDAGYQVLLPDLPGHGASPLPGGPTSVASMADAVVALLDRLKVKTCVLGGFSMGGYVALETIRRHPGRFTGLVLADTRAEPDSDEAKAKRAVTAAAVRKDGMKILADAMIPQMFTEATRQNRSILVSEARGAMLRNQKEGAIAALGALGGRPDQRPTLAAIRVPALVVVGAEDPVTPPSASETMARALPDARLVVVAGAAHLTPMEQPEAFNRALLEWLRESKASGQKPAPGPALVHS